MRGIAAIDGFFRGEVVVVLRSLIAGVRPVVGAGDVVEELRVRIGDENVEAGVEAVVVVRLKGVVDGEADGRLRLRDAAVLRVRREQMTASDGGLIEAAAGGLDDAIEGVGDLIVQRGPERVKGRVELAVVEGAKQQLGAMIADEGGGQDIVAGEGVLHAERVVLDVGRAPIAGSGGGVLSDILKRAEGGSLRNKKPGGKRVAERRAEGDAVIDRARVGGGLAEAGVVPAAEPLRREEDTVAAAEDELAIDGLGEAEARREVGIAGVVDAAVIAVVIDELAGEGLANLLADGVGSGVVEVGEAVLALGGSALPLVAQAEIEGEGGGCLPVILGVEAVVVLADGRIEGVGGGGVVRRT